VTLTGSAAAIATIRITNITSNEAGSNNGGGCVRSVFNTQWQVGELARATPGYGGSSTHVSQYHCVI
jgi:hypothetical protein